MECELDLYLSKKDQLKRWCKQKGIVTAPEIEAWGIKNYYICARRRVREFVNEGLMRPANDREREQYLMRFKAKFAVYVWCAPENYIRIPK